MTRKATTSTATRNDGRKLTRGDRAQQRYLDRELEAEAQEVRVKTKRVADDMRESMLTQVLRLLSGRW